MKKITVILIDDERLAREEIKRNLRKYPDMEVLGEADNAADGARLVRQYNPDLLLLDIQMPGQSGFDLLEMLDEAPEVIFITAFDEYAVKAFEVNALDYMVKPVRDERFEKMAEKVRLRIAEKHASGEKQLFVKDGRKCYFIRMADLFLVESLDNYAKLHFNDKTALLKRSLNQLENTLDPATFFRVNRSQIVNIKFIQAILQLPTGRLTITLTTGLSVEASDRQSARFRALNNP